MKPIKSISIGRRQFLITASGTVASLMLSSFKAKADLFKRVLDQSQTHGFFVLLTTNGGAGLDATLGLDPLTHEGGLDQNDVFLEYKPEDILHIGNIKLGPAAAPLQAHAKEISIINGIMMRRDSGHTACLEYMQSGDPAGLAGSLSVEHSLTFADSAFGTLFNSYSIKTGVSASAVTQYQTLQDKIDGNSYNSGIAMNDFNDQNRSGLIDAFQGLDLANQKIPTMKTIQAGLNHSATNDKISQLIASAFMTGSSYEAQIEISAQNNQILDTHSDHEGKHLAAQKDFWQQVSDLFTYFKSIPYQNKTLFDATTFYVTSEFSRTPALNPAKGKDHNPFTNSALIAGKGFKAGSVVGKSRVISGKNRPDETPIHIGLPYDYSLSQAVTNSANETDTVSMIYPENVVATLRQILSMPGNDAQALKSLIS